MRLFRVKGIEALKLRLSSTPRFSEVLMRMVTPMLSTLSVPVASPVPDALQQFVALRSCVANTLGVACA
jgi:hypothetical protein